MDVFSALADPTRRDIVEMLAREGPLPASDIAERFPISAPAISQHLKVLRDAQVVHMEKRAQQRIYRINPGAMLEVEDWARNLRRRLEEQFDAVDRVLEAEKRKLAEQNAGGQPVGDIQEDNDGQAQSGG